MSKLTLFERLGLMLRLGGTVDPYIREEDGWIRYKDLFILVGKGDDGYFVSWQRDIPNHVRIDEMYIATKGDE